MVQPALPPEENEQLRAKTQSLRLTAVRLRIESADIFCNVAESELRWEPRERTQKALEKIWHSLAETRNHIQEPQSFSPAIVAELESLVAGVEARAAKIAARLNNRERRLNSNDPR